MIGFLILFGIACLAVGTLFGAGLVVIDGNRPVWERWLAGAGILLGLGALGLDGLLALAFAIGGGW